MAKLYITAFAGLETTPGVGQAGESAQIGRLPSLGTIIVTHTGTSVQSDPMPAGTKFVRVHTDAICHVTAGSAPTASAANMRMAADSTEYFGIAPGQRIAAITGV